MEERILYLKGTACPFTMHKVFAEDIRHQKEINLLARQGITVINLGTSVEGFSLLDVEDAFREFRNMDTVIVDVHGDDKQNRHNVVIGRDTENEMKNTVWVGELYQTMAQACGQRPLKIFMFSCGSGEGYKEIDLLPEKSTVFNLTQQGVSDSYLLNLAGYNVPADPTRNFAERFFLNILFKGFDSQNHYIPTISVNSGASDNVWTLWDVAKREVEKGDILKRCLEKGAVEFFKEYVTEDDIANAIKELGRIAQRLARSQCDEYFTPSRPSNSSLNGQICALSYFLNQKQIGAFHSQPFQSEEAIETAVSAKESAAEVLPPVAVPVPHGLSSLLSLARAVSPFSRLFTHSRSHVQMAAHS